MLYEEKKRHFISAIKFTDKDSLPPQLNLQMVPPNNRGFCNNCGHQITDHALLNGQVICPNNYIIYEGTNIINVMTPTNFENLYKPIWSENEKYD